MNRVLDHFSEKPEMIIVPRPNVLLRERLTWNDNVEDEANVLPRGFDFRYVGDKSPHFCVSSIQINDSFSHKFDGLLLVSIHIFLRHTTSFLLCFKYLDMYTF